MKKRDVLLFTGIFVALVIWGVSIVFQEVTKQGLIESLNHKLTKRSTPVERSERCTEHLPRRTIDVVFDDPQVKAAQEYEKKCASSFLDYVMIFTSMPSHAEEAEQKARALAKRLRIIADYGLIPMVIVEPETERGLIDFAEYAKGDYDIYVDEYFKVLKSTGLTDQQLGLWVPFPEPQQDFWNNNGNPEDFAKNINRHSKSLRKFFPTAKLAILLDSQVGEHNRSSMLLAYTRLIDDGAVNVVGLQGFPWHAPTRHDRRSAVVDAGEFLQAEMIDEVAKSLKVKDVLLNSGSYRRRLMRDGGNLTIAVKDRQQILQTELAEAVKLRAKGYNVIFNIFAENKLKSKEAVDWSYWSHATINDESVGIFKDFIHKLHQHQVKLSIYDKR